MVERIYYVYAYLRKDGSPYYIGKGKGKRYKSKKHNVHVPDEDKIQFIANNLTNQEACNFEILLISKLGRKDIGTGILRNQTFGGDGGDTSHSKGYQEYMKSEKFKDVCESTSERMKIMNPMFNKELAKKVNSNPDKIKKQSEKLSGVPKSENHKRTLSEIGLMESEIRSKRMKEHFSNPINVEIAQQNKQNTIDNIVNMCEEDFSKWISDKNIYDKLGRPNARIKTILIRRGEVEKYYGP